MTNIKNNKQDYEVFIKMYPDWEVINPKDQKFLPSHEQLLRTYSFSSDKDTYDFSYKILVLAEEKNHHPTLVAEWHKVTLSWSTHDQKSITQLDLEMAKLSDEIFAKFGGK